MHTFKCIPGLKKPCYHHFMPLTVSAELDAKSLFSCCALFKERMTAAFYFNNANREN